MLEKALFNRMILVFQGAHGTLQIDGIPQHDSGHHQIEARRAIALLFETAIANFTEPVKKYCPRQGVTGLTLVQSGLRAAPQIYALQPVENEQRALDAAQLGSPHETNLKAR